MTKDERIRKLEKLIEELEARLEMLEARPQPNTWSPPYVPGGDGTARPWNPFPNTWTSLLSKTTHT